MSIIDRVKAHLAHRRPLEPGFHVFRGQLPDGGPLRLHLRIEAEGAGLLIVNATKVVHLNQTGAEFAKLMFDGLDDSAAARTVAARYRVSRNQAGLDYRAFKQKILRLAGRDDECPVAVLELGRLEPFSMPVSAPYRVDLALTYRCPLNCGHCYAGGPRETKEMGVGDWKRVLDKLLRIGVPHVCFTGGEATLREDLADLIAHAEDLGLVTGLLTNGCRLDDPDYVAKLLAAGLDHVQITLESHQPEVHDRMVGGAGHARTVAGIENAVAAGLYTITNTTLTRQNAPAIAETVRFLHGLGLSRFAMNAIIHSGRGERHPDTLSQDEAGEAIRRARETAAELGMGLIWYSPTRYCELDPVELGLGMKRCTAGQYNLCIEPDGAVLPCQSYFESVGNILTDEWDAIWRHPLLTKLRERHWVEERCRECDQLDLCGGGCPLDQNGKTPVCVESMSTFSA